MHPEIEPPNAIASVNRFHFLHILFRRISPQTLTALIGRTIVALAQHATDPKHRLKPDFVAEFITLCITSLMGNRMARKELSQHSVGVGASAGGRQLRLTMLSELPFAALLGQPGSNDIMHD